MNAKERGKKQREVRKARKAPTGCATLIIALLAILMLATVASAAMHSVQYVNTVDDWPDSGQQTWLYHVKSNGAPAVSHVSFATSCPCEYVAHAGTWEGDTGAPTLTAGGSGAVVEQRADYCEVKWDEGMGEAESRDVYVTVNGIFSQKPTTFTIKAGQEKTKVVLPGPQCSANAVTLTALTAQQKDNDILTGIMIAAMFGAAFVVLYWIYKRIQ